MSEITKITPPDGTRLNPFRVSIGVEKKDSELALTEIANKLSTWRILFQDRNLHISTSEVKLNFRVQLGYNNEERFIKVFPYIPRSLDDTYTYSDEIGIDPYVAKVVIAGNSIIKRVFNERLLKMRTHSKNLIES